MAHNKTTLFLGDLSTFCTERDIHNVFAPYGEVLEIKIMRSEETYRNLSYGFIKFAHPAAAKKAMNGLNGVLFCGRNLRIGWASYKNRKEPKTAFHHDRIESSSIHVSYISYQLKRLITEESLRVLFSAYGVVLDTSIKKSYIDESINRQCGYGFVHYSCSPEGIESALAAVAALNDTTIDGVCYKCSISHNLEKHLVDMQSQRIEQLHESHVRSEPMMTMHSMDRFSTPYNGHSAMADRGMEWKSRTVDNVHDHSSSRWMANMGLQDEFNFPGGIPSLPPPPPPAVGPGSSLAPMHHHQMPSISTLQTGVPHSQSWMNTHPQQPQPKTDLLPGLLSSSSTGNAAVTAAISAPHPLNSPLRDNNTGNLAFYDHLLRLSTDDHESEKDQKGLYLPFGSEFSSSASAAPGFLFSSSSDPVSRDEWSSYGKLF
eukprot:gene7216-7982_t